MAYGFQYIHFVTLGFVFFTEQKFAVITPAKFGLHHCLFRSIWFLKQWNYKWRSLTTIIGKLFRKRDEGLGISSPLSHNSYEIPFFFELLISK